MIRRSAAVVAAVASMVLAVPGMLIASGQTQAGGSSRLADSSPLALSQKSPALPAPLEADFFRGRSLFRQLWVEAPAPGSDVAGLGPVFNRPR